MCRHSYRPSREPSSPSSLPRCWSPVIRVSTREWGWKCTRSPSLLPARRESARQRGQVAGFRGVPVAGGGVFALRELDSIQRLVGSRGTRPRYRTRWPPSHGGPRWPPGQNSRVIPHPRLPGARRSPSRLRGRVLITASGDGTQQPPATPVPPSRTAWSSLPRPRGGRRRPIRGTMFQCHPLVGAHGGDVSSESDEVLHTTRFVGPDASN